MLWKSIEKIDREIDRLLRRVSELEEVKQELVNRNTVILPNIIAYFHRDVHLKIRNLEIYVEPDEIFLLRDLNQGFINNKKNVVKFVKKGNKVEFLVYGKKKRKVWIEKWKIDALIKSAEEILGWGKNGRKEQKS